MSTENNAFWRQFDMLTTSLGANGRDDIRMELDDARKCVNGFPDGWARLLDELKRIEVTYRDLFLPEHRAIFYYLISVLKTSLFP